MFIPRNNYLYKRLAVGRIITGTTVGKGYKGVKLVASSGQIRSYRIHHLVLEAFAGQKPANYECRHLNGKPSDNHLGNLKWGTHSENMRDRIIHGTSIGETVASSKLKESDVIEIRRRLETLPKGTQQKQIADAFGVNSRTISAINRRKIWAWLT